MIGIFLEHFVFTKYSELKWIIFGLQIYDRKRLIIPIQSW